METIDFEFFQKRTFLFGTLPLYTESMVWNEQTLLKEENFSRKKSNFKCRRTWVINSSCKWATLNRSTTVQEVGIYTKMGFSRFMSCTHIHFHFMHKSCISSRSVVDFIIPCCTKIRNIWYVLYLVIERRLIFGKMLQMLQINAE